MLGAIRSGRDPEESARSYADDIVDKCRKIGEYGEPLIKDGANVMTHCNAGALATVDYGTALAPMRVAWNKGKKIFVYVSETRPRLQGMKLTAYELLNEGIPHAIIPDGASGHFMRKGVDVVIVGADRIASNGDFANKIGTYEKAVLAKELGIPFYTAAPISTFDFSIEDGTQIPIEDRNEDEVTMIDEHLIAPKGCHALNPSFDITPNKYVTGIITEIGVRKTIVEYGKLLYQKGLTVGTGGNISARGENDTMLITPTNTCKGMLEEDRLVVIGIKDAKVLSGGRPSIETPFHLAFYRARPEVNAVIHPRACGTGLH